MRVDKKQSKKDQKELLFDGGDEVDEDKPKSKAQRKQDKYADDMDNFKQNLDRNKYAEGIVKDRACTDVLCLVLFGVFVAAMIVNVIYCLNKGNISKYIAPASFYGTDGVLHESVPHLCGYDDDTLEYPKLYLTSFTASLNTPMRPGDIMSNGICLKKCPDRGAAITDADSYTKNLANIGFEMTGYDSRDILNICVPKKDEFEEDRPDDYESYKELMV